MVELDTEAREERVHRVGLLFRRELPEKGLRQACIGYSWVRTSKLVWLLKYMSCSHDK